MKVGRRIYSVGLISLITISIILSGCGSLESDITPPTQGVESVDSTATPRPTQQPAATVDPDQLGDEAIIVNIFDQSGGELLDQGVVVELAGYEDFELVYENSTALSSLNQVVFTDTPLPEGRVYFASISLDGAIYRSEITEVGPETSLLELNIQIYPTTTSDESLIIDRVHLLIDFPAPDYAQVVEIYILSNLGEATVVSANPGEATVSFPLPEEALAIEFENGILGQRYLKTEDGFGDTVSIPPGAGVYQVLVYYQLPVRRSRINFSQEMSYPAQAVIVMTPAGEGIIKGSNLVDGGVQSIPDGSVQIYSSDTLARGESLDFRLTIQSAENTLAENGSGFLADGVVIGLGLLGGLVFAIGVWLFLRQRGINRDLDEREIELDERNIILDSIIALEELYQEGEIDEKAYLKKRQEYKTQLKALDEGEN